MDELEKEPIFIIIPVHNRKNITLSCLNNLNESLDLDRFHIIVIDDGSTDGTFASIRNNFPTVKILHGDGNLWWTGAIEKGMEYAYKKGAEYFIWLNDDTLPARKTISLLIEACRDNPKSLLSGQCYKSHTYQKTTFGGQKKLRMSLQLLSTAQDQLSECDCLSGNLVCLPRSIIDDIGFPPSHRVPHNTGDVVYTYFAKQAGYKILVLGSAIAVCDFNPGDYDWLTSDVPISDRWKILGTPKSYLYFPSLCYYCMNLYGAWGILIVLQAYVKLVLITFLRWTVPMAWLKKIKAWIHASKTSLVS